MWISALRIHGPVVDGHMAYVRENQKITILGKSRRVQVRGSFVGDPVCLLMDFFDFSRRGCDGLFFFSLF